jgi:hypothetical protein
MLANGMVIAPRRRLEGRPPSVGMGDVVKDMDPITQEQIASITFDSEAQAIAAYKYIVRAVAVRTKVAYLSDLLVQIQSVPGMAQAFTAAPGGPEQLAALVASKDAFLSLTQPNTFQNLQMIRNHLEVNVFPKSYNLGIEGRLPSFQSGMPDLSYSDVKIPMPATFSFGDLTGTGIAQDLEEMKALGNSIDSSIKLGAFPVVLAVVIAGIWGALALIWGIVHSYTSPARTIDELLKWAKENGVDPKKVQDIMDRMAKVPSVFEGASNFLMWASVLVGTGVVGWIAWNIFA